MSVQGVIAAMDELNELHLQLIAAGKDKQEAIMQNDTALLTQIMNKESKLLKQVTESDEARMTAVQVFLEEKGIRSKLNLTITELSRLVFDPQEKQQLHDAQRRLSDTLLALKDLNASNRDLIEQSLTFIDYSLNLIVSRPEDDMIYQNPGQQQQISNQNRGFFDTRA